MEEITYGKLLGIIICFVGAVIVGLQDSSGSESVYGDIMALLAAAGYGVYTTLLRYKVRIEYYFCLLRFTVTVYADS